MRPFLLACLVLFGAPAPSLAQFTAGSGCDITTGSYAVVAPPRRGPPKPVISVMPQTPCATIPNGWEDMLPQITVDVDRTRRQENEGEQPTTKPLR